MRIQTLQEQAEELLKGVPRLCSPAQLGEVIGLHYCNVNRLLNRKRIAVMRTPGGHRRIPRDVQVRLVADALRHGRE